MDFDEAANHLPGEWQVRSDSAPPGIKPRGTALLCDQMGTMWVAYTSDGLWKWSAGKWEAIPIDTVTYANSLGMDAKGQLYVGGTDSFWRCDHDGWHRYRLPAELQGT